MSSTTASSLPVIAPFWTRMPSFFGFPFQWAPLLCLVLLSALSLLGLGLAQVLPFWLAFPVVEVMIALAVGRYAFRIIQQVSQGLLHSSDFTPDWQRATDKSLPWKLLGVLLVWGFVVVGAAGVHPVLALALNLALSFALPAIVVTLVQDESFVHSLNPGAWWRVMRGIGWPYVALVLFVLLLSEGSETVLGTLMPRVSPMLLLPVAHAVLIYFSFVMACLIGYAMYQNHEALGIDLQQAPRAAGQAPDARSQARETDRHVSEMVTSGNLGHAIDVAYEAQRVNPDDLQAHARYHQVLALGERPDPLSHHAGRYIPLLVRQDLVGRALQVFNACRERGAAVVLDEPQHLLALARHQWRQGDAEAALAMLTDFEKQYPGHAQTPAALELRVRVLVQGLQRKEQALAWVQVLEARHPASPHTEEARWLVR